MWFSIRFLISSRPLRVPNRLAIPLNKLQSHTQLRSMSCFDFCRLWRRRLDAPEAQELPSLEEACGEVQRSRGALLRRRLKVTSQHLRWDVGVGLEIMEMHI